MYITPEQQDALSELINIGFGRAAATLSVLVGKRILLEAPLVELLTVSDLRSFFAPLTSGKEVIVQQTFKGPLSGDSLLFIDIQSATVLVDLLSGGQGVSHEITDYDREALIEIGNILLNSYIGSFANILSTQVNFSVPSLCNQSLTEMINHFEQMDGQVNYTLLVKTDFHITNRSIGGYVILFVGINSLEDLLKAIEDVIKRKSF